MAIDKSKFYRTRDGREVRIYATDHGGDGPICGAIKTKYGWEPYTWKESGLSLYERDNHWADLIEVKPRIKREYWVNVYPDGKHAYKLHSSKEDADENVGSDRIACVKVVIDCVEGEGL